MLPVYMVVIRLFFDPFLIGVCYYCDVLLERFVYGRLVVEVFGMKSEMEKNRSMLIRFVMLLINKYSIIYRVDIIGD